MNTIVRPVWEGTGHVAKQVERKDSLQTLKKWIWVYGALLLFEGALRKWVFPGLSNPLLIVRDPVALIILFICWKKSILPTNTYTAIMLITGLISLFVSVLVGHGNILVALYGLRICVLHFPLLFVIGRVFTYNDVIQVGKVILFLAIPMVILTTVQFYSPQNALVNRGVGGNVEGGGFSGALGYFRPPGTFSFTSGNTQFFSLVAPFVCFFWTQPSQIRKWVLIGASVSLLMAIPLSISRSLFYFVAITFLFWGLAATRKPGLLGRLLLGITGLAIALYALSFLTIFQNSLEAFLDRFTGATEFEGGAIEGTLGNRYLGGMWRSIINNANIPFFGYGLGIGTSVGSTLVTGQAGLTISEDEWGRVLGEQGLVLGLSVVFTRVVVCIKMAVVSYKRLTHGFVLPWLLLSYAVINVSTGQWAQPTSLGFSIVIGGLLLAALQQQPPLPSGSTGVILKDR